ncbi:hypothetical protein KUTeg_021908 [Tegillarca granosa]|uniref:Integrase core domain-containing protein n=1 Tax=Tegillarca granosa TaxID=220873 RepID=A0ABQ9E7Q9_TEGGR|nr:hypothetical protein KUTeg_021908 [Tegillarca granosa]
MLNVEKNIIYLLFILPLISKELESFRQGWNNHKLCTENNLTPHQLWLKRILDIIHSDSKAIENLQTTAAFTTNVESPLQQIRLITFLQADLNNKACTVLRHFVNACSHYGILSRVRIEQVRRIGMLNVEKNIIYLLFILPLISKELESFRQGWNNHKLCTENNLTRYQLWLKGILDIIHSDSKAIENLQTTAAFTTNVESSLQQIEERHSDFTGRSVHNQRIGRSYRKIYNLFDEKTEGC